MNHHWFRNTKQARFWDNQERYGFLDDFTGGKMGDFGVDWVFVLLRERDASRLYDRAAGRASGELH